jgi:hypothetical protein
MKPSETDHKGIWVKIVVPAIFVGNTVIALPTLRPATDIRDGRVDDLAPYRPHT